MCTRFYVQPMTAPSIIRKAQRSALAQQFLVALAKPIAMTGEIRPTDIAAVIAPDKNGGIAAFPMMWGFHIPQYRAPIVNCRIETAPAKPLWSDSWLHRRCIIPATWYYEWEHIRLANGKEKAGNKYMIQPKGAENIWLAGLYRFEEHQGIQVPVFSVVTRPSSDSVKQLHDRMPLLLPEECAKDWVSRKGNPARLARYGYTDMVIERVV